MATTKAKSPKKPSKPKAPKVPASDKTTDLIAVKKDGLYTRNLGGRRFRFDSPEDIWEAALKYFDWCEANPLYEYRNYIVAGKLMERKIPKLRAMTQGGLQLYLGITRQCWNDYCKRPIFLNVCEKINLIIYEQKLTGAAADLLNPVIIAKELGLREYSSTEVTGKDGAPLMPQLSTTEIARRVAFVLSQGVIQQEVEAAK